MKNLYLIVIAICLVLSACKKDEANTKFDASYQAWKAFKKQHNNSYTYTAYYSSVIGLVSAETKFTIRSGKITGRDFILIRLRTTTPNPTPADTIKNWKETAATINTHANEGHELLTIDEIYSRAKNIWLKVDATKNIISFETSNDGLISSAGYIPKDCMDDCITGVYIKDIKAL